MWETIRMFLGFLFSLGLSGFAVYKRNRYWLATAIIGFISAIMFLGQFVSRVGG